jgi:hypothetical protein
MATALLAGCSSAQRPARPAERVNATVPSGYVALRGSGYVLARPAAWTQTSTTDEQGNPLVEAHGAPGTGGAYRGQVIVARRDHYRGTMGTELDQARTLNTMTKRQITVDAAVKVPGSRDAHRIEAVYDEPSPEGGTVRIRIVDLYVLTPGGTMLDVAGRAADADFGSSEISTVLGSLRVTP